MIRKGNKRITNNRWLEESEKTLMINYIKEKVDNWCFQYPTDSFSARTFFGGENYDWRGTPLITLYEHYAELGEDAYAVQEAGKSLGRLFKEVISIDKKLFDIVEGSYVNTYILVVEKCSICNSSRFELRVYNSDGKSLDGEKTLPENLQSPIDGTIIYCDECVEAARRRWWAKEQNSCIFDDFGNTPDDPEFFD